MCAADKKSHELRRRGLVGSKLPRSVAEGWGREQRARLELDCRNEQSLDRYCKPREWKEQDRGRVCRSVPGGVHQGGHGRAEWSSGSMGLHHEGLATFLFTVSSGVLFSK